MEELETILATLRRIEARLAPPSKLFVKPEDRDTFARMMPVVWDALGGTVWTVDDLLEHGDAQDSRLRDVLHAVFGTTPNRKVIGKLLARVADRFTTGVPLQIERVTKLREGILWKLNQCDF